MTSYRLMIPSWHDINDNVIVVYDVEAMLALRHSDKDLTGHPSKDLPPETWGTIPFPARKAARWAAKNRLLKVRMKDHLRPVTGDNDRITYSVGYVEPEQWQAELAADDWHWITQLCEVSHLYKQQVESEAEPEPEPEPKPKPKRKRKRVKAKERRRMQRRERIEADY